MENNSSFNIENPEFFWLFLLIPILGFWYFYRGRKLKSYLLFPFNISLISNSKKNILGKLYPFLFILRLIAICFVIYALSRPRDIDEGSVEKSSYGIDIIMAVDVSGSMLAKDLKPNRLEALKKTASEFVMNRKSDRIGIVSYAGEAFTLCPLTSDLSIVHNSIKDMEYGFLEDGTAIGMGLGVAINRLNNSPSKSKVIILLTDGVNTAGNISPAMATDIAKDLGIKVYTIAIGTNGFAEMPYAITQDGTLLFKEMKVEIDEVLMKKIAEETGGNYYRATNNSSLQKIYEEIDRLEKTKLEDIKYYTYNEKYRTFIILAIFTLLLEITLRFTLFRSFI